MKPQLPINKSLYVLMLLGIIFSLPAEAQDDIIGFESDRWVLKYGEIVNHLGRKSLEGAAYLKDVTFENGIIEVEVAVSGARSYPGIIFRMQGEENYENVYIRPHRAGLYPDALQYTPVFNGQGCWQLYNGAGFTAPTMGFPPNQWIHLKLEISGTQARLYLNHAPGPALVIPDLKHGITKGYIGVSGPKDKTAYFSNFRFTSTDSLEFNPPPQPKPPKNLLTQWEISQAFPAAQVDISNLDYPRFFQIFNLDWKKVSPEAQGLVNISRYAKRNGPAPDCVFARTVIRSDKKQTIKLPFGYSDEVSIFLNGKKISYGNSSYRYRDPSFLGIVGFYDAVYLTLEKGLNEIFLMVKETFGGWGFMCQADRELLPPCRDHQRLKKVWETPKVFLTPESVLYDPKRDILYVTNFDSNFRMTASNPEEFTGYISKVTPKGEIENLKWVTNLHAPTGLGIYQDKLYTVERRSLVEIDIASGKILKRVPIPGADFLNDIVIDAAGNIYLTDTTISPQAMSCIHKFKNGQGEVWMKGDEIERPNGLFLHDQCLIVGNTGDGCLKSINLATRQIHTIASLGAWVIDGINVDPQGNYLVSHWNGLVYVVSPTGQVTEILDTMTEKVNSADFEWIKEKNFLVIPTYNDNRVMAYRY